MGLVAAAAAAGPEREERGEAWASTALWTPPRHGRSRGLASALCSAGERYELGDVIGRTLSSPAGSGDAGGGLALAGRENDVGLEVRCAGCRLLERCADSTLRGLKVPGAAARGGVTLVGIDSDDAVGKATV